MLSAAIVEKFKVINRILLQFNFLHTSIETTTSKVQMYQIPLHIERKND